MEIINLGKADGLPPVEWGGIVDKLDAGSGASSGRDECAHDVVGHRQ